MRPRFVALLPVAGNTLSADIHERIAARLPIERRQGDNHLFMLEGTPVIDLPHARGWLIGTVFDSVHQKPIQSLRAAQDMAIESSGGRLLLQWLWGSYAAIWQSDDRHHIFREPSGSLPLFVAQLAGLTAVTSDIGLLVRAGLIIPEVDWAMVEHGLLYPHLPTAKSHLRNVSEVLPAMRLTLDREGPKGQLLWEPWKFANPEPAIAASPIDHDRLRSIVDQCVAAWAESFRNINLELSGGLDSSIIAVSLGRTAKAFTCANIATPGTDGDERDYARCVADQVGASLSEHNVTPDMVDPMASLPRWTPRPRGMRIMAGLDAILATAASDVHADAIFSGGGGDNVFCFTSATAPVLDALSAHGVGAARVVASNLARMTHTTEGEVFWHSAKRCIVDRLGRRWPADRSFLTRHVRCPLQDHPWMHIPKGAAAGTRAHIGAIVRIHDILDAHQRTCDQTMIFPLLSQPVLETCLSIPSWYWLEGGRDRAVARDAFADRLPSRIFHRSSKGVLNSLLLPAFEKARLKMREMLCEGLLAQYGLLDRAAIAKALSRPISEQPAIYGRILELVDADLWVTAIANAPEGVPPDR